LAEKIRLVLDRPAWRDQLGAAGRRKAESDYDWRHIATELEHAYLPALGLAD
jgi:glycosyltransferase involved in cell wall biosynthesis